MPTPSQGNGTGLTLALVILVTFATVGASGDESLEWKAIDSDVIVRGGVVETRRVASSPKDEWEVVTIRVAERLKGPPAETVRFLAGTHRTSSWGKEERLFFLVQRERSSWIRSGSALEGGVGLACRESLGSAITMDRQDGWTVYNAALKPFYDGTQVATEVRRVLARQEWERPARSVYLYFSGIDVFPPGYRVDRRRGLDVALMPELEGRALEWAKSNDPYDRWNAAQVLGEFRSSRNQAVLMAMLDDPFATEEDLWPGLNTCLPLLHENKWTAASRYCVREAAYRALARWDAAPSTAVIAVPPYPVLYLSRHRLIAAAAAILIALGGVFAAGWGWGGRTALGVSSVSAVLLASCAALWFRGTSRVDELSLTASGGRHVEVASMGGRLRLLVSDNWTDPSPPVLAAVPRTPTVDCAWDFDGAHHLRELSGWTQWDFAVRADRAKARCFNGATRVVVAPLWAACALFGVLPARVLVSAGLRRRRTHAGRCGTCGYDLRASPGRCPECGCV